MNIDTKTWILVIVLFLASFPLYNFSQQIILKGSHGDSVAVEIHPTESFLDVIDSIQQALSAIDFPETSNERLQDTASCGFSLDFLFSEGGWFVKAAKKKSPAPRNFYTPVTSQDKNDITEIVKTLANSSLVKIKSSESSLKRAGDRIDPIHPFRFLITIFSDEELKVCLRNLQGRSWVWKKFLDGITDTLAEESTFKNVIPYVAEFAALVNVNVDLILPSLQNGKWEKFVNILIDNIPRQGDAGRYDL